VERAEWLKQMRGKAEALYDQLSPEYWVNFGLYANETHREYLQKFLGLIEKSGTILSAACGAGRYDGILLEAGYSVVGIDQSAGMLARARERFPGARYEKMGLQEMYFREEFDGVICMDAMEHICPEDWPGILQGFREALKPGGVLYFTLDLAEAGELEAAYERAKGRGLPVVFGEVADEVDAAYERVKALGHTVVSGELADVAVYHYYPSLEQVRAWIGQAGLTIEEEGTGNGYQHFVSRKKKNKISSPGRMPGDFHPHGETL
jgi:SAM-dependent methyltransferase